MKCYIIQNPSSRADVWDQHLCSNCDLLGGKSNSLHMPHINVCHDKANIFLVYKNAYVLVLLNDLSSLIASKIKVFVYIIYACVVCLCIFIMYV